ncbi:MAG TPA: hypothetical protein ENI74_08740 [Gammaproteobacteria bacterium]|nr:hypothetical protein [Gammaproteobacteria bacterium]
MSHNQALLNDDRYLQTETLGSSCWLYPTSSVAAVEYDQMHCPWHTQKNQAFYSVPKFEARITGEVPAWLNYTIARLSTLSQLRNNWDSYGALPIRLTAHMSAAQLLSLIMSDDIPLPDIVPTPSGGIQIEWHMTNIDLEVEIAANGHLSVFFEDAQGEHESVDDDLGYNPSISVGSIPEILGYIQDRSNP